MPMPENHIIRMISLSCIRCNREMELEYDGDEKTLSGVCPICKTDYMKIIVPMGMPEKR